MIGTSAPMPSPVSIRHAASSTTVRDSAAISMPTAISARVARITVRRPYRSASGERKNEPSVIPTNPLDNVSPSAALPMPHSAETPGAAKAIASTS